MNPQAHDLQLLDALRAYTLNHASPRVDPFKPSLRDWGDAWQAVQATHLPVADMLVEALTDCDARAFELLQTFIRHNHRLHWEQSYRKQDGLVPDAMLDGYGFAEIIGLRGPFVSDRIRAGIAIWGPGIDYPQHHHQAAEAYILLSGSVQFRFADCPAETRRCGDVVYVESNRPHGFRTDRECLVACYLWQGGDLRQTSRFA